MNRNSLTNKFWDYNSTLKFGISTIAIYLYLLEVWTKNKKKDFVLSDSKISRELSVDRRIVRIVKKDLKRLNLIEFSYKKGKPSLYRILYGGKTEMKESKTEGGLEEIGEEEGPKIEEFLEFAERLSGYKQEMQDAVKEKYGEWKKNGWKNKQGKPVNDWKKAIKAILPFLEKGSSLSLENIPNIKRP
jgi:uncharacterized protein (UPF0335 family)